MKTLLLVSVLCVGTLAGASLDSAVEAGPGNVLATLKSAVRAMDAGDADLLEGLLAERLPDNLYGWPTADASDMGPVADRALAFAGVRPDGRAWAATDRASVLEALAAQADAGVRTKVLDARASCDSERASWVVATLERRRGEGDAVEVQRVRLTAVMQWVGAEAPQFRIWHWQETELPLPVRKLR